MSSRSDRSAVDAQLADQTIGLNGLFLDFVHSGTWRYTRRLTSALAEELPETQFRVATWHAEFAVSAPNLHSTRPKWPFPRGWKRGGWSERLDKFGWEQIALPASMRRCALIHSLYFAAPFVHHGRLVVTVHDALPLREEYGGSRIAAVYSRLMRASCQRADALITVSEHARGEIADLLNYPAERIFVTPEAPDPAFRRADEATIASAKRRNGLPDKYILYLGGTEERKNLTTLVRAWAQVMNNDTFLVIVGRYPASPLFPHIPTLVTEMGIRDRVRFTPEIGESDLAAIYSGARAFCYPSTYEGFGLPPLEAMACGTPVLASNATSLPEVIGVGGALLPAGDVDRWAEALTRVISEPAYAGDLAARGLERAKQFSWNRTAQETANVYASVLA